MSKTEMINKTESARAEILRGLAVGDNPFKILLIAVDCIGKLSGDTVFTEQCRKNISVVYSSVLNDPQAVQLSMNELEERISRIKSKLWNTSDHDTRERLLFSVRQMQNEYKKLAALYSASINSGSGEK